MNRRRYARISVISAMLLLAAIGARGALKRSEDPHPGAFFVAWPEPIHAAAPAAAVGPESRADRLALAPTSPNRPTDS